MCRQKIFSLWRFSQNCRTPSGLDSLPCPLGRNTEGKQQVLSSLRNHSRGYRKQRIPVRLFVNLDAIVATCHGYKPGTRCCHKCLNTARRTAKANIKINLSNRTTRANRKCRSWRMRCLPSAKRSTAVRTSSFRRFSRQNCCLMTQFENPSGSRRKSCRFASNFYP